MTFRKRNQFRKGYLSAAVFLAALFGLAAAVHAETEGSITLILEEGISPEGICFSCTKVGEIAGGEYILEEPYRAADIELHTLENSMEMREAAEQLALLADGGCREAADGEGKIRFEQLPPGLYLLKAEETGEYRAADAALAAIPSWEEETGSMAYDITVVPKFRPYEPEKRMMFDTGSTSSLPLCLGGAGAAGTLLAVLNRRKKVKHADR